MFDAKPVAVGTEPPSEDFAPSPREWSAEPANGLLALDLDWSALQHGSFEQLERIAAWEKVIAYAQAMQASELALFYARALTRPGTDTEQAGRSACAEVALMLRVPDVTARARIFDAETLAQQLPAVLAAVRTGQITMSKARIIAEQTAQLSPEQARAVAARVLDRASSQTPGQLRASVRRAVARADTDALIRRARAERKRRGVWLRDEPDGMATLEAYLPAPEAVGAYGVLDECARTAAEPGEDRTMDQRRADALVDLILDGTHADCRGDCPVPGEQVQNEPVTEPVPTEHVDPPPRPVTWGPVGLLSAGTAHSRDDAPPSRVGRRASRMSVQVRVTVPYTSLLGLDKAPANWPGTGRCPPTSPGSWLLRGPGGGC